MKLMEKVSGLYLKVKNMHDAKSLCDIFDRIIFKIQDNYEFKNQFKNYKMETGIRNQIIYLLQKRAKNFKLV